MLVRKTYISDPPPAEPPAPDTFWDFWERLWMENDASLRRRVKAALGAETGGGEGGG